MPKWTPEQEEAIYKEGCNILVSAGAGSGKTAVLSERALRKVKDGINIDQILILTFTKAAAYEMMLRIRSKIKKAGLIEQVNRIDKAYITTFDSFALSIVKKYHDKLNINKDVKIVDDNVISLLKKELLNQIFEKYYQSNNEKFNKLIADFCLKDDKEIKEYIISLNDKLDLKYDKRNYLITYISKYYSDSYIDSIKNEYLLLLSDIITKIDNNSHQLSLILDGDDYSLFADCLANLLNSKNYDDIKNNLNIKLPRLPKNCGDDAKKLKEEIANSIKELTKLCLYDSSDIMLKEYYSTKDYVEIISEIILELDKNIEEYKFKYNSFEFIDISKLAIKLVSDYEEIRNELKYYFNEIMIDEYQDTSDLQEEFISKIANNNIYMVGDIKQSIYRFRNANPLIFKQKYDDYAKNINGYKIDLNRNFRSREEVLENINKIFDLIMDDQFGGASYKENHRMVFGNNSYKDEGNTNQNYNLDILTYDIDKDSDYIKYSKDELEAFIIANDIKDKIDNKYQVFDKENLILRDITYNDFVILMDRSSKFTLYKKIFEYMKIPLTILKDENIMDQAEVYLIRNILRLIEAIEYDKYDNNFKYSFLSLARSYLFRLSDNDIFHIINTNSYYDTEIYKKAKLIANDIDNIDLKTLIERIKEEFLFDEKLISIGNIEIGLTVLDYFINLAIDLQSLDYDYHKFIAYLDNIINNKKEIKIPVSIEEDNSCKIMTIHKSKGLEYYVCYYSGMSSSFNISELKEEILFDNKYGIITPCFVDGYSDIFIKNLLKNKYYQDEISEKIRLFYVALTRSKEKMIIVANLKENDSLSSDDIGINQKENYRSFLDILKSIKEQISNYIINVNLDSIPISMNYKLLKISKIDKYNGKLLEVNEYKSDKIILDEDKFSKNSNYLFDKKTKDNIKFGTRIHEILELIDFKNPELDKLELSDYEKEYINNFLNQDILKNIKKANVLKEYEFYTENGNVKFHGFIDLMLEYSDYINIIDYKLKNIEDEEYLKQLNGYKSYIESKTNKKVFIYLYSILDNNIEKLNY